MFVHVKEIKERRVTQCSIEGGAQFLSLESLSVQLPPSFVEEVACNRIHNKVAHSICPLVPSYTWCLLFFFTIITEILLDC